MVKFSFLHENEHIPWVVNIVYLIGRFQNAHPAKKNNFHIATFSQYWNIIFVRNRQNLKVMALTKSTSRYSHFSSIFHLEFSIPLYKFTRAHLYHEKLLLNINWIHTWVKVKDFWLGGLFFSPFQHSKCQILFRFASRNIIFAFSFVENFVGPLVSSV